MYAQFWAAIVASLLGTFEFIKLIAIAVFSESKEIMAVLSMYVVFFDKSIF